MAKLTKYTLDFNEKKDQWDLTNDKTNKVVKSFDTKDKATAGGILRKAVGNDGGSVKIQKTDVFKRSEHMPKSSDPKNRRLI
ncbi:MAG: DUF2188 domain-containing protein [Ignavibacteria bacterium]|nr:DUF2188 domain-containing protein [Ignavibacteria bacterium]